MEPTIKPRRRPLGVIVVALIQLCTLAVALVSYFSDITLPWEGAFAQALSQHSWARIAILLFGLLVVVAAVSMWYLRPWGLALMISLVALSLVMDIVTWAGQADQDRHLVFYLRMATDVVCAFYLNSSAVQTAFRGGPTGEPPPLETTAAAGRIEP